jgi:tetratricopeptide (TPR) repeat protein
MAITGTERYVQEREEGHAVSEGPTLNTIDDLQAASLEVMRLLDDREFAGAIGFADAATGSAKFVRHLRALSYTHAGRELNDENHLETAIRLWEEGIAEPGNRDHYNLANAELNLWELRVKADGFVSALEGHRAHLHRARELYADIGRDSKLPEDVRVQALTNLGNSFDSVGRNADGVDAYREALVLDPAFGMALGNKGVALLGIAPLMQQHVAAGLAEARDDLDAALKDRERILQVGGAAALEHFEKRRASITLKGGSHGSAPAQWTDPYWRWCAQHNLFLHVSPRCIDPERDAFDPLFFRSVKAGLEDEDQQRVNDLFDAFNAIKQDYAAARYLLWLVNGDASPIREQAAAVSTQTKYLDSLRYARWGARTGLAVQAFAAATNLLDKVACFVHLYFETGRKIHTVSFRTLWHPRSQRNKPVVMDPELAAHLVPGGFNRGLSALCDLSCDLEQSTPLNALVERRHSATHRFLTVHSMPLDKDRSTGRWLEQVGWTDLIDGTRSQLAAARSALIYLAWMIDIAEKPPPSKAGSGVVAPMPIFPAETEHPEFD